MLRRVAALVVVMACTASLSEDALSLRVFVEPTLSGGTAQLSSADGGVTWKAGTDALRAQLDGRLAFATHVPPGSYQLGFTTPRGVTCRRPLAVSAGDVVASYVVKPADGGCAIAEQERRPSTHPARVGDFPPHEPPRAGGAAPAGR